MRLVAVASVPHFVEVAVAIVDTPDAVEGATDVIHKLLSYVDRGLQLCVKRDKGSP